MAESSKTFNIMRLNNENYATWSFEVEMLLRRDDLWQYIEEEKAVNDVKWKTGDGKALATISLACERTQYSLIQPCKTSREAWHALKERHEKLSTTASAATVKRFCTMTLETGGDIEKFLHEWESMATKLERNNFAFEPRFKIFLLLGSLPEEYHPLVVALESRDNLEMSYVKGRLIDESKRLAEKVPQAEQLMFLRKREMDTKQREGIKQNNYEWKHQERSGCWRCGDLKHLRHQCPYTDKDLQQNQVHVGMARTSENCQDLQDKPILMTVRSDDLRPGWYLDSGASNHICKDKACFRDLKPPLEQGVRVANGAQMKEKGRGKIQKQFLDEVGQVRKFELQDVLYVPDVKANFVSVSQITKRGLEVQFEGAKAFVKRQGQIVAIAELEDGLYRLKEASISGTMTQEEIRSDSKYVRQDWTGRSKSVRATHRGGVLAGTMSRS